MQLGNKVNEGARLLDVEWASTLEFMLIYAKNLRRE